MRAVKTTTIYILAISLLAGSAVKVLAQDEEAAAGATSFTGRTIFVDYLDGEEGVTPNGLHTTTGAVALMRYESSDPRLTGDVTITGASLEEPGEDGFEQLRSSTYELTNAGGSWLGQGTGLASFELNLSVETVILVGRDGYEGLTAYLVSEDPDFIGAQVFNGLIFPASMPQAPESGTAE